MAALAGSVRIILVSGRSVLQNAPHARHGAAGAISRHEVVEALRP